MRRLLSLAAAGIVLLGALGGLSLASPSAPPSHTANPLSAATHTAELAGTLATGTPGRWDTNATRRIETSLGVLSGLEDSGGSTPVPLQLPAPTNLVPDGTTFRSTTTSVAASWGAVAGAVSYAVRMVDQVDASTRDPRNNCPGVEQFLCIDRWPATSITVSVAAGRTYTWWVHATDSSGTLGAAAGASFTVQGVQAASPRLVGPVVFHWFGPRDRLPQSGQYQAVWLPLEGRDAWNGSVAYWTKQERDLIDSGANVILFQVAKGWEQEQRNHLLATKALIDAGYRAPLIVPNFAAESWECYSCRKDLQTAAGKDAFYQEFRNFFTMYFQVLDRAHLATLFGKVLIDLWYVPGCEDASPDILTYVGGRLQQDFQIVPYWSTAYHWASHGADEVNYLFTDFAPFHLGTMRNADLLVGEWRPTSSYPPAAFVPRDSGRTFEDAWSQVFANADVVDRVYIESWNEYSEGSGMFEAQPLSHYPGDGHPSSTDIDSCWDNPCHPIEYADSWGPDPRLYIRISALNANRFLGRVNGATFVTENVPSSMETGGTYSVSMTLRNAGDTTWSRTVSHYLGLRDPDTASIWSVTRVELGPSDLVAPGQTKTFEASIRAPATPGDYAFQWQMSQDGVGWFGETTPGIVISVHAPPPDTNPPVTTMNVSGTVGQQGWFTSAVVVTLGSTDNLAGVASTGYSVDRGAWRIYSGPFMLVLDGNHSLEYRSVDRAGNSETTHQVRILIDRTGPEVRGHVAGTLGNEAWYVTPANVTLSATDAGSGVASVVYRIDGGVWIPYAEPFMVGDGSHVIGWRAEDAAGNPGPIGDVAVAIDTTDPVLANLGPAGHVATARVIMTWTGSDAGSGVAGYTIRVDGRAFGEVGARESAALTLADGKHTITVRATDRAGNSLVQTVTVTVDANPFSFTGPYGGIPAYVVAAGAVVGSLFAARWLRSRGNGPKA